VIITGHTYRVTDDGTLAVDVATTAGTLTCTSNVGMSWSDSPIRESDLIVTYVGPLTGPDPLDDDETGSWLTVRDYAEEELFTMVGLATLAYRETFRSEIERLSA
jgi:hypothetical protein